MKMLPRLLTFTAGDGGPVITRVWVMPETALTDLLDRARAGEKTDDLMLDLVLLGGAA